MLKVPSGDWVRYLAENGRERVSMGNSASGGGACQSSAHVDGRTQGFLAENCLNHHTVMHATGHQRDAGGG